MPITTAFNHTADLDKGAANVLLRQPLSTLDANAHVFVVEVKRGSEPADLTGARCEGWFVRADGVTVPIDGEIVENTAIVTLLPACYEVPGRFALAVKLTLGDVIHTILRAEGSIDVSRTDALTEGGTGVQSFDEIVSLLNAITGGNLKGLEPATEDIPIIFFGKALPQTKDEAAMPFHYVSRSMTFSGYCKTKAQGNSSMEYPKKNQTAKLYYDKECTKKAKIDFRGWGKQSKFCLKANWIDITHARNIVSARLWGDVVKSRGNYDEIPKLLRTSPNQGAVDGFPVKVYAAGVYQGRYTLNIPKDAWMANMNDGLDTHCILCGESAETGGSGHFRAAAKIDGSDWSDEIHDVVPESIKTRWNEVISFVMNSNDSEFKTNLADYIDVPSLLDYYLFGIASCHFDGFGKNQLYMTYDGQRWYASAYDMDSTWGLHWTGQSFVPKEEQTYLSDTGNLLYWRLSQLFKAELKARWVELRSGALSESNVIARFEEFISICPPYIVEEDYATTTAGGAFVGIPSATTNNIHQIRKYVVDRLAWSDMKMGIDAGGNEVTNYTNLLPLATDASGAVYNGKGYKVNAYDNNGTEAYNDRTCLTGFIPCKAGDVIRIKNMPFNTTVQQCRLSFYTADKTFIGQAMGNSTWFMDTEFVGIKDDAGNYISWSIKDTSASTGCAYVRITAISITDDSIVTINEPIGESGGEEDTTNEIRKSTDANGNPYGAKGYRTNWTSNGTTEYEEQGICITGFMPCTSTSVIQMENMEFNASTKARLLFYDTSKQFIENVVSNSTWYLDTEFQGVKDANGNYTQFTLKEIANINGGCAYIRIAAQVITDDSVVTITSPA